MSDLSTRYTSYTEFQEWLRAVRDYAVDLVNQLRNAYMLEPIDDLPRGYLRDPHSCPIAHALEVFTSVVEVGRHYVYFERKSDAIRAALVWGMQCPDQFDGNWIIDTPEPLREFVDLFDDEYYPEYKLRRDDW